MFDGEIAETASGVDCGVIGDGFSGADAAACSAVAAFFGGGGVGGDFEVGEDFGE